MEGIAATARICTLLVLIWIATIAFISEYGVDAGTTTRPVQLWRHGREVATCVETKITEGLSVTSWEVKNVTFTVKQDGEENLEGKVIETEIKGKPYHYVVLP